MKLNLQSGLTDRNNLAILLKLDTSERFAAQRKTQNIPIIIKLEMCKVM